MSHCQCVSYFPRPSQNPTVGVRGLNSSKPYCVELMPTTQGELFLFMVNCTHSPYILLVLVLKTVANSTFARKKKNPLLCI